MRRTDLMDTTPEAHLARLRLLREKSVEWRIQKTFELVDMSRAMFPEQTRRYLTSKRRPT
ncbi:MAG: hypothetical protein HY248_03010 [Fimbriimonas ginsengisoli]|uniref:Uncharacterized protein n=1 Tax=Fimbriimonas ginsengisoli TaxID=1005039 RepID=A0A931PVK3_FIMGI|nr:hypothetical protein [Fimbriimonas ginsengisoli]MBI3721498.1 hypothetical protein [Fimbriimonas ginsengisoli]